MSEAAIIWGATGHARVVREALQHAGVTVIALFDNDPAVSTPFPSVPIFHGQDGFDRWRASAGGGDFGAVVAIGGHRGRDRHTIQNRLASSGLSPLTIIHPTAFVAASATLGRGAQVLAKAAVCVDVVLGEACIVNTSASIDHECVIGHGVHVCPGATLAGSITVEDYATIGSGAVVLPRIRIGARAHVGAGAVVTKDVPADAVVAGNPARPLVRR